jgi:hypothetical protein
MSGTQLGHLLVQPPDFGGDGPGTGQDAFADLRHLDPARGAVEDGHAQFLLGLLQGLGQGGLRFSQRRGGRAQAAVIGDSHKDLDVLNLHGDKLHQ